jgi:hypothetical protein
MTNRIGTRPLCFKERAKFVSPSFLVIRILLKSELQHSLDSPLRFGPRQRGPKGGDGVEEPVHGGEADRLSVCWSCPNGWTPGPRCGRRLKLDIKIDQKSGVFASGIGYSERPRNFP